MIKRLFTCSPENMGNQKKQSKFMPFDSLGYGILKYEKFIAAFLEDNNDKDDEYAAQKRQERTLLRSDSNSNCTTSGVTEGYVKSLSLLKLDSLFGNEIARRTYETFTERSVITDEDTSIMPLNCAAAWMTELAVIRKFRLELFVLRNIEHCYI